MKKLILYLLSIIILVSCNNSKSWDEVNSEGTLLGYKNFIKTNPKSTFINIAQQKIDSIDNNLWENANKINTIEMYQKYIKNFPNNKKSKTAKKRIDSLKIINKISDEWQNCINKNDTLLYKEFIKKHPESLLSLDAQKKLFLIKNPEFKSKYKKILHFFEKIGKDDFNKISFYFAYKTIFQKNTQSEDDIDSTLSDKIDTSLSDEILDSIRIAKSEPKTPPYTKEQLMDYGFANISNPIIYNTFLNKIYYYKGLKFERKFTINKNYFEVEIIYWENENKGDLIIKWVLENNEWCISEFINNIPKSK